MVRTSVFIGIFGLLICSLAFSDVVINEIHYNPPDDESTYKAGSLFEFIELYNPGSSSVDLSGYQFTKGVTFVFPEGTVAASGEYLVLAQNKTQSIWRNKTYQILGPYEGTLADGGERLELARPDGTVVDSLKYNDKAPWSRTPDGYGESLERIAWDLPSDDFHSWRASLWDSGTPGVVNSVVSAKSRPMITAYEINPQHPTSKDPVSIRLGLDGADVIDSVSLQWEQATQGTPQGNEEPVAIVNARDRFRYWKGKTEPSAGDEWTKPEFDDSTWPQGQGSFGYGGWGRFGTQLSDMRQKYSTLYLRIKFNISEVEYLKNASLMVSYTGGFVCYVNGVEVARANAPQPVVFNSLATGSNNSFQPSTYTIQNTNGFLQGENNTLALVGLNDQLNKNQFSFSVYLNEGERASKPDANQVPSAIMDRVAESVDGATFEAQIPAMPSQSLVRFNAKVTLKDKSVVVLPYVSELRPFESYFVFDGEIQSPLNVLWPFYSGTTKLTEISRSVSGAVILPPNETAPLVFDGAFLIVSRNGQKLKFLKGEEYRGDRTLNIIPERPQEGTSSGISAPHRENLGFWFFQQFGIPACRTDWFRIVLNGSQTQQMIVQQINEKFLEMNGLNSDGDLFKRNYVSPNWEPHTNLENGTATIDALCKNIQQTDTDKLHAVITENLVVDEFVNYLVASVLTSNWDGFHNNNWMYLDPATQKWLIFPWDLDKAWGYTDNNPQFTEMPIEFPLNGKAASAGRDPGPITGWLLKDPAVNTQYIERLTYEFNHKLTEAYLGAKIDEMEQFLLADLTLLETQTGKKSDNRRSQITTSYTTIREFLQLRRAYLSKYLQTPVSDWSVY